MEVDSDEKQVALRLKTIAEAKYTNSNIKSALKHAKKAHLRCPNLDGLSSMLTAFKILRVASKTQSDITDWYKILQVEPFSHINTIKKEYKKLALILHPDKNSYLGCEEAFKLVGEGFRVLSDKIRRKEYDMRLRIKLQEERINDNSVMVMVMDTFWTACSRCRLLHQFERRYLGHSLVCPNCKKSFEAVEVEERDKEENGIGARARVRVRVRIRSEKLRRQVGGNSEGTEELGSRMNVRSSAKMGSEGIKRKVGDQEVRSKNLNVEEGGCGVWGGGRLRAGGLRRKMSTVDEVLERSKPKRTKFKEEMMTLAEMQVEAKKKAFLEKEKLKKKRKDVSKKMREKVEKGKLGILKKNGESKMSGVMELEADGSSDESLVVERHEASRKTAGLKITLCKGSRSGDLEKRGEKDAEFYDFDKDRTERCFKKGQVWAIYDDDRMPRCYGLIDEVVSFKPFEVKLSWLDLQSSGEEGLFYKERTGFHVACGRFKVSRTATIKSLDIFSHVMDCERAAKEVYRIFPKKGTVWALYNEVDLGVEGRNMSCKDKQSLEIVVFLTSYSKMYGLSMAYLEQVDGFNTIFKRREVGAHAIRWLDKNGVHLLSHQIPARKLSGDEVLALLKDCWELDPTLLPLDLLANE